MGQALTPRVEVLEVDRRDGLVLGPHLQDTSHGPRYDTLKLNDHEAYKWHARFSSTIFLLSKAI